MDRLHAMRVFSRVARLGSFARAADDLELSRAAVSEAVAALERHLGARLLTRTTRRLTLTGEGAEFLERAVRILAEVDAAEEAVRGAAARPRGTLRVDVPTSFGRGLLVPALPQFLKRYPELKLDLRFNDRVVDLVADEVDVAVRVGAVRPKSYVARRIATTRRIVVASPGYLAGAGRPQRPEDLAGHRLLGVTSGATGRAVEWRLRGGRVVARDFAAVFNLAEAQLAAALAGAGLAQTIDLLAGPEIARGRLETVLDEFVGEGPPISVVYPATARGSARVRVFSDFAEGLLLRFRESLARGPRG
ncbi:MAG: LysR family transcriptional regulator [Proteobacteria bacterium]|nr:LysR family transcriptional regulator [Pseudomonadota bacterium]